MNFIKADYLGENTSLNTQLASVVQQANNKVQYPQIKGPAMTKAANTQEKMEMMKKALEKIRRLDVELAQKTKFEKEFKNARINKQREEDALKIQQQSVALAQMQSQMSTLSKTSEKIAKKQGKGKPPSAAASSIGKPRQAVSGQGNRNQEDETDNTFVTGLDRRQRTGSQASNKKRSEKKIKEEDDDDLDQDELQDVVYDYEQTQAMMEMADDFLHQPLLSLPAPGDDKFSPSKSAGKNPHNMSQMSFKSGMTSNTDKNFLAMNKEGAKNYNPYKKPMICDQLNEASQNRLKMLTDDIDQDLDGFLKMKEEYFAQDLEKSQFGGNAVDPDNAYLYSKDAVDRIEKINESLRKVVPMLPPSEEGFDEIQSSATKSVMRGAALQNFDINYDISRAQNDDRTSLRSLPMSAITRRSNITMLTHQTFEIGLNGARPGEKILKKNREERQLKKKLQEIDSNLRKITESDDLSYAPAALEEEQKSQLSDSRGFKVALTKKLIDQETLSRLIEECKEEEDRYSIMYEEGGSHTDDPNENRIVLHSAAAKDRSMRELQKLEEQSKLLKEADEVFVDLEKTKDRYLEVLDTVNEREKSILSLESKVNQLLNGNEQSLKKNKAKNQLKNKIDQVEEEVKHILENLESKEQLLQIIKQQESQIVEAFESKMVESNLQASSTRLTSIDEAKENEEDERLLKILLDIEHYNRIQEDDDREEKELADHNFSILEDVQRAQEGRNDEANELEQFAKQQLDVYKKELEEQASNDDQNDKREGTIQSN